MPRMTPEERDRLLVQATSTDAHLALQALRGLRKEPGLEVLEALHQVYERAWHWDDEAWALAHGVVLDAELRRMGQEPSRKRRKRRSTPPPALFDALQPLESIETPSEELLRVAPSSFFYGEQAAFQGRAGHRAAQVLALRDEAEALAPLIEFLARLEANPVWTGLMEAIAQLSPHDPERLLEAAIAEAEVGYLCEAAAMAGLVDSRLQRRLLRGLNEDMPGLAACYLVDLGDSAVVPALVRCLDRLGDADWQMREVAHAIEALGGTLSPFQEARVQRAIQLNQRED